MLIAVTTSTQAAPDKKAMPAQPISIVADEMYFSDKTGELFAQGNVVIIQDKTKIMAQLVRGNDKETQLWIDGSARLLETTLETTNDISGMKIRYNYGDKYGQMNQISGKCGDNFIKGDRVDFQAGKYTVYDGTTTGCPAKGTPDYRITARKIEIWPNDKMIAYDAKVWIKNTVIYSTPRYKRSLKKKDEDDEFPRFGYQDPDGFWISQKFSYAVSDNLSAYADMIYYSRLGFRPQVGLVNQEKDYLMRLTTGQFRDDNNNWIRKEPEFRFDLYPKQLGSLPVKYTLHAIIGKWSDDFKSSWHQDYNLYFRHDPIYLDRPKSWALYLGTGLQHLRESMDSSQQTVFRYNASLHKRLSPAMMAWAGYNYVDNNSTTFAYNRPDVAREGILGLSWRVNNRTTLSYYSSYDFANSRVYENYYSLKQNFHCWEANITYRSIKKELMITVNVVRW
jgi:LPS-assembly protein